MKLGYNLPTDWSYSIASGAWVGGDAGNPAYLHNRKPAESSYFTWSAGSQTTSSTVSWTATRDGEFVASVGALLGSSLPEGTKVVLLGKRTIDGDYTYDLGGNSQSQRLVTMLDGTTGCVWEFAEGLDAITAYRLVAYNDVNGAASIVAETQFKHGEIIVCPALKIPTGKSPSERWIMPGQELRTLSAQATKTARSPYREVTARGVETPDGWSAGGAQAVQAQLARDPFTLMVVYDSCEDYDRIQKTSVFGLVSGLGIGAVTYQYQAPDEIKVAEVPAA